MILFVAAESRECEPWVARWNSVRPAALPVHWARAGEWKGREMVAIANGAGPERARAAVLSTSPAAVWNIGFCGALDPAFRIGDILVGDRIRNGVRAYPVRTPSGPPSGRRVTFASQPRIAQTAREKRELWNSGASAVEMEAAGAARASEDLNVPFYCVRAVSDLAEEDFANDFNRCLMPDGRFSVARLVAGACASPVSRFGELIRLSRRTALAARNLGEFLAHCEI